MASITDALSNIVDPKFDKQEITNKLNDLPSNIKPLESKIAGHDLAVFYDEEKKFVLKPIFDIRGVREERFYKLLFDPKHDQDSSLTKLRSFLPAYIETLTIKEINFVALSDLTSGTVNPSLMDVKMGFITYDRNATEEKIQHEITRDHLNKELGFKALAVRKWINDKGEYEERDRVFCRNCKVEEEEDIISFYLKQSDEAKTGELISSVLDQLNKIFDWFNQDNINLFEFIGSSIFFIYTYNNDKLDCRLKMIDFAHIFPLNGTNVNKGLNKDNNYLSGLRSLMGMIEKLKIDLTTAK